jgi:hypothetical protein
VPAATRRGYAAAGNAHTRTGAHRVSANAAGRTHNAHNARAYRGKPAPARPCLPMPAWTRAIASICQVAAVSNDALVHDDAVFMTVWHARLALAIGAATAIAIGLAIGCAFASAAGSRHARLKVAGCTLRELRSWLRGPSS